MGHPAENLSEVDRKQHSPHAHYGSNASVELAWRVGFTPDFGRMVATQRTDASGQSEVAPNKNLGT